MQKKALILVTILCSVTAVQPYFYNVNPFRAGILPNVKYETVYIREINNALAQPQSVLARAASLANPGALALLRKSELFAHAQQVQKDEPSFWHKLLNTNLAARLGPFAHVTFPLVQNDAPKLIERVREYSDKLGIMPPMVFFVNASSFANVVPVSFGRKNSALIIGRGILERQPESEINRVLIKELSHIYHNHDIKKVGAQAALMGLLFGFDLTVGNRMRDLVVDDMLGWRTKAPAAYHLMTMALRFPLVGAYKGLMDLSSSLWTDHFTSQALATAREHLPTPPNAKEKQSRYLAKISKHDHDLVQNMIIKRFTGLNKEKAQELIDESNKQVRKKDFGVEGAGWFDTHLPLHEQADQMEDEISFGQAAS